jgi:hypothetical protein
LPKMPGAWRSRSADFKRLVANGLPSATSRHVDLQN